MNRVILSGRLTKDPQITHTNASEPMAIARYTLAVDRAGKDKEADFPNCICFGKTAEFVEKYLTKGMKVIIEGRIQTGSYTNKDGQKVYTTDVVVDKHEFAESKAQTKSEQPNETGAGFMEIPIDAEEEGLPWN